MALPAVVLGIGRIVSGVVAGTARGLAIAGRATVKGATVAARATAKGAGKAARATGKAARSTGKAIGKTARSTGKGLKRITSRTSKSTGKKTLKSNAEKIRSNLTKAAKDLKKQRLNRDRIQRNVLERGEVRKMEKNIESTKTPTGKKVNSILKSPMSIFDKIFGFGGILLTGIIVNAIDGIVKKWEEFKRNNQPIFDFLGNAIKGIGDFINTVSMKASTGELDWLAKVDENGKVTGGLLLTVKQLVEGFGSMLAAIMDGFRFTKKSIGSGMEKLSKTFEGPVTKQEYLKEGNLIEDKDGNLRDKDTGKIPLGGRWIHKLIPGMQFNDDLGDQSSISSNSSDTQVVFVRQTNTKIVPVEVPSPPETNIASSGTSQSPNVLWTGVA